MDTKERKYVAISIKHSTYDKEKTPLLWGYKRTGDEEKRCFSGYTVNLQECEIYSLSDFQDSYGNGHIKCDEPVKMCFDFCKRYKKFDTVLVDLEDIKTYLSYV